MVNYLIQVSEPHHNMEEGVREELSTAILRLHPFFFLFLGPHMDVKWVNKFRKITCVKETRIRKKKKWVYFSYVCVCVSVALYKERERTDKAFTKSMQCVNRPIEQDETKQAKRIYTN